MLQRRDVTITGKVQGVWYRVWTKEQAEARGLSGWVKNEADGSVRACFEGEVGALEQMLEACKQGPEKAVVDTVDVVSQEEISSKSSQSFSIELGTDGF